MIVAMSSLAIGAIADPWQMTVSLDKPGAAINPGRYGLMTEEINHAYDGGLYAELIQNRSFKDDPQSPVDWSVVQHGNGTGIIALDKSDPANPSLDTSLKLTVTLASAANPVGASNSGFWGIPVKPNTQYRASFYAKSDSDSPLTASIESNSGNIVFAKGNTPNVGAGWKKYTVLLKTGAVAPSLDNRFVVSTTRPGNVWLSFVSLFPPTFNNRPNGNRIDLMEKMQAMKPAFLRFPGGNYVDPGHYMWKIALGPVDQRTGHPGAWGYRSSDGIGLLEYLQWCEDLKMEPLLAVTDGRGWLPADGDVSPLVQDALDEIQYVTGGTNTKWGAKRAADGHPAPYKLRYVEIGNEDFFDPLPVYEARFAKFFDAIRAQYPDLKIIATRNDIKNRRPDIVDDHIYASAADMFRASHNYDFYDRTKPKVFVGEWATTEGSPTPTFRAALGDAAYLTGLERNSDVVTMSSYAPLLVNVNPGARQWGTNLIGYDALNSFASPSYYVQTMFNHNVGTNVLPVEVTGPGVALPSVAPHGGIGVGTWQTQAEFKDARVTRGTDTLLQSDFTKGDSGWNESLGTWSVRDGVLAQSSDKQFPNALAGDPAWTDYTYSVKARRLSGAEGFLIFYHALDDNNLSWLNVGGWGNKRTAFQHIVDGTKYDFGPSVDMTIADNRWYNIRIEVAGRHVKAYIDDALVVEADENPSAPITPLFVSAVYDKPAQTTILKVVNTDPLPQQIAIQLAGATSVSKNATGEMITGQPDDMNSIENPTKDVPHSISISNAAKEFTHEFPGNSVTVLRIKSK